MRKLFVMVVILSFALAGVAQAAETATVNVTVSIGQTISVALSAGSINLGSGAESGILTGGSAIIATNDGNISENLELSVGNSANWTASATAVGVDQFIADFSIDTGVSWAAINPAGGTSLVNGVAKDATQDFHLQIQLPSSTDNAGVSQTIPVTVTASAS